MTDVEKNPAPISDKNAAYRLSKEMVAAKGLMDQFRAEVAEDEEMAADLVEGETDFFDCLDVVIASMDEDAIMVDGLKARIDELSARMARYKKKIETKRTLIEQSLQAAELSAVTRPTYTLSIRNTAPGLVIVDEEKIPAKFWVKQDPKLDKKALASAVKEVAEGNEAIKRAADASGKEPALIDPIPGVTLDNGGISLTIRRK